MDRRSFIKLTAISTSSAALASCGNPEHQLIRFVPDEDIVPGIATWKPSVCPGCTAGCGLTVRVMDADAEVVRNGQAGVVTIHAAKKLEGSPDHPVNRGGLCARGQAAIQITYHPDRITQPLRRSGERGDGRYEAVSWDDALAELVKRLDALQSAGNQKALAFLARPGDSVRTELVRQFLAAYGAPGMVAFDLFEDEVLRRANALSFGRPQLPTFDLANARYVINFGSDILGTWNSPVSQGRAYGDMRQGRRGVRGVVHAGRIADVADRRERRRVGAGHAGQRRRAGTRPGAGDRRQQAPARGRRRPGRRARRGVERRPRGLHAGRGAEDHGRRRASHRTDRARARGDEPGGGHHRRPAARADEWSLQRARGQRAERAPRQRRAARRSVFHAAAGGVQDLSPQGGSHGNRGRR